MKLHGHYPNHRPPLVASSRKKSLRCLVPLAIYAESLKRHAGRDILKLLPQLPSVVPFPLLLLMMFYVNVHELCYDGAWLMYGIFATDCRRLSRACRTERQEALHQVRERVQHCRQCRQA